MVDQRRSRAKPLALSVSFFFIVVFVVFASLSEPTFQQSNSSSTALSSQLELSALFELRSSLGLRSHDWPRKNDPCSAWTGISCDRNGRVVGINVSRFRRTRVGRQNPQFAVDSLVNFTLLQSFNASGFFLPGSIPDWFGRSLGSLRVLDLSSCSVLGPIPPSLGNLTNLTGLNLSWNSLSGSIPVSLGQLVSLSLLDLSHNSLSGSIPASFGNLKNLSALDLSNNSLIDPIPPAIGTLSALTALNFSGNNLSSSIPPQLGDLAALVDLDLGHNSLSGSLPPDLRGLRSLKRMFLGGNSLGGSLPESLFTARSQLEVLVLRDNRFLGELPGLVWTVPGLRMLDISGNNFTGLLPNSNLSANASIGAILNAAGNSFYGGLTRVLARFSSIDLSGNYFQGRVPNYVLNNATLVKNCLQILTDQRTQSECQVFYAEKGLAFDNFGLPSPTQPPPPARRETSNKSSRQTIILAAVFGTLGLILLVALLALVIICIQRRGNTAQRGVGVGPVPATGSPPPPGVSINYSSVGDAFTYQQLLQATGEFSDANLIKNGHSGDLFRGVLESGVPVVVKRIDLRRIKKEAHAVELDFFGKVSHTRFVPFLGHCLENENEKYLVYKYMPNGDLSDSLHKKSKTEDDGLHSLDWITRLKIALGAAEGLSHLHHECNPPLVHRDVQASSILLDDKFEVRLGSLSEACAQEGDTHQSKITRLLRLPQSSEQGSSGMPTALCSYDVYCFGKVLLELVTGKIGISASSDAEMKEWLEQTLPYISIYDKELVTKILDPSLIVDEDLLEEVWAMAVVARSCLNPKPTRRPPMRYILKALENPLKVVREENSGSARLRTTSSRGSWNAALFGSWRSSSDITVIPVGSTASKLEGGSGLKHSGTTGSQGSGTNGQHGGGVGELSSSHRRNSRDIFPEPSSVQDVERADQD